MSKRLYTGLGLLLLISMISTGCNVTANKYKSDLDKKTGLVICGDNDYNILANKGDTVTIQTKVYVLKLIK
jgi:hypothetical protein